jgi:hypothetical protein
MPTRVSAVILFVTIASFAKGAPLSGVDLTNLLAGIRQNRSTQADFQEQRMIRLMKKPILSDFGAVSKSSFLRAMASHYPLDC